MKDLEQARLMLKMSTKDYKALAGMLDLEVFEDEIFGFHVQQAVERALKAWLASLGVEYPKTHDLRLFSLGSLVSCFKADLVIRAV